MSSIQTEHTAVPVCPVQLRFLRQAAQLYEHSGPVAATPGSAGFDLRADIESSVIIEPGCRNAVPTGIAMEPQQPGVAGFVYSRSGLGAVKGLTVAQGVGVIDPDYRGELTVFLLNTSGAPLQVERGDRIAQLIFQPYFAAKFHVTDTLGETERGTGGFGHTGKR